MSAISAPAAEEPAGFYWYDLETSGTHPPSDRIMQFAGRRTDAALNPVDAPFVAHVRLAQDVLPSPEACLVTGLVPRGGSSGEPEELDEWQALRAIAERLRETGTCIAGYNNLRFDDDFLRHGFYRNLMDPYAHEWEGGNSRWDLLDVARAACALRPEGIEWPHEDGVPTFRLERLSAANGVAHGNPHDALADVEATLGIARLLRAAQPKLWRYALGGRSRQRATDLLLPLGRTLCVHVSRRYANARGCIAPVISVARNPEVASRVIVADLGADVEPLIELNADALRAALFDPDTPPEERPAVKQVALNRCPFLAPIRVVRPQDARRLGFDAAAIRRRLRQLRRAAAAGAIAEKLAEAYRRPAAPQETDPELALYDGFAGDDDKAAMRRLQEALARGAPWPDFAPRDPRLRVLGARLKARLRPDELSAAERAAWSAHARRCRGEGFGRRPSLAAFRAAVAALGGGAIPERDRRILDALAAWGERGEQGEQRERKECGEGA